MKSYNEQALEITCLKEQIEIQQTVIEQLRYALDFSDKKKIKRALAICAGCKKIRNGEGIWNSIEAYIQKHSDVKFTHGICPDCSKKLYPEYHLRIEKKKQAGVAG